MALYLGQPGWAGTRKIISIWISLKQETGSGSGISWYICKSAPRSRQITTPAPHRSVFYRPNALPVAQPTVSKHWRTQVGYPLKCTSQPASSEPPAGHQASPASNLDIQSNLPKWILLKWITHLSSIHLGRFDCISWWLYVTGMMLGMPGAQQVAQMRQAVMYT